MQFNAPANHILLGRAADFLRGRSPVLILAGTREAADDLARRAAGPATVGVYRHSLRDLVLAMSEPVLLERGLSPVRRIAREAVAAEITARTRSRLTYLAPVAGFPGFPRALARTLEDLRLNRIASVQLHSTGRSGPDLALLLDAYEDALARHKFADHASRCAFALDRVEPRAVLLLNPDIRTRLEQELIDALKTAAPEWLELNAQPDPAPSASRLDSLQRHVLTGARAPALEPDATVAVFSASGEALECVEIARRILRLAASGTRFDQIAVLLRSPERHQPLIDEALQRAGIPAWYSQGVRRPDPSGRAFITLLQCAAEDLSAARFAEYLSLGQMPAAEEGELRLSSRWERLLSRAMVISGPDRWERRLEACLNELKNPQEIGALEALRGFALPIVHELAGWPREQSWGGWLGSLTNLALRTLDDPATVLDVLAELSPMRETSGITLADVLATLEPELVTRRREESKPRYGRVFVGALHEAAGMCFDAVFLPGLNEGVFPKPVREDPLLLDTQRLHLGLQPRPHDDQLLRAASAAASKHISCSWSRIDLATARERVPSFYAFEVAESAGWGEIDVQAFILAARTQSDASLGWPAPTSPVDAIDSAEYDLATLHPHWDTMQPGIACWLKDANPHLYRALEARRQRWEPEWCSSDGLIHTDVHVGIELEKHFAMSVRPYAPTRLEQFARCPYRFYLQSIAGLRSQDRPAALQRISPGIRGELVHEVHYDFYTRLQKDDALPVRDLDRALQVLDETLNDVADRYADKYMPAIPLMWATDIARIRADLRAWLRYVALKETDWTPVYFEHQFDDAVIFGGMRLEGRIDLIEQHRESGRLRITDYKTGKRPEKREFDEKLLSGELLQPMLYAMAAAVDLNRPVRESRLFYATVRGNYEQFAVELNASRMKRTEAVLQRIDKSIRDAVLPAFPRKDACRNCDYLPICGPYEEQRVAIKKAGELE